jgi:hypothetical protein
MMLHRKTWLLTAGVFALALLGMRPAWSHYVFASSDMAIFNLRFSSPDPNAQLIWTDEWFGTVAAHAHDTNSGSDDDYDDLLGNDGFITAQATTAHVNSEATYAVTNGDLVAIDPAGDIAANSHSDLEITHKHKQADGFAIGDFDNFFTVFGGTPGDAVDVTFELDYLGQLTGIADYEGFFEVTLEALLELQDVAGNLVADDLFFDSHSGTNTSFHQDYNGTLSATGTLLFDEEYWLFAEADSEIYGSTVPLPGTLLLTGLGLGMLGWRIRSTDTLPG